MGDRGWEGESGRRRIRTTVVDRSATAADDLMDRDFSPTEPDVTWVGDITYLRTGEGWLFLATVIDLLSRRVIGWSVADHMLTSLVADALGMAAATRGGAVDGRLSNQYSSADFGRLCRQLGVTQSMGATGVCWDNAPAESFFGTLKRELANRRRWITRAQACRDVIRWIEGWCKPAACNQPSTTTRPSSTRTCSTVAVTSSPHNQPVRPTGATRLGSATNFRVAIGGS